MTTSQCAFRKTARIGVCLTMFGFASLTQSCGATIEDESEDEPTWDRFLESSLSLPDGTFIVDGDIRVGSVRELRAYYDQWLERARPRDHGELGATSSPLRLMTVNSVDSKWPVPTKDDLTYCVSSDFGTQFNQVVSEMAVAGKSWSNLLGINFRYVPSTPCNASTNVVFDVVPAPAGATFFAAAPYPHFARSVRELLIHSTAFTTNAGGRDFQGILRHELGHVLGFRHEHIVLSPPCTSEGADDPITSETEGARQLTPYDVNSVMHYPQCRPSQTGGYRQTLLDYHGGNRVYGLGYALISSIEPE
jgi:serralysin